MKNDILIKDKDLDMNSVLNHISFPVLTEPIYLGSGEVIRGRKAIVRQDSGLPLSVVSDSYLLLPNREVFSAPLSILNDECGFNNHRIFMKNGGARTMVEMLSRDDFNVPNAPASECYKKRIILENSYDMTSSLRIIFGSWRLKCRNGAGIWVEKCEAIRIVHTGDQKLDKIRIMIKTTLNHFNRHFDNYMTNISELNRQEIRTKNVVDIFKIMEIGKNQAGKISEKIEGNIQGKLNLLTIYNAYTEFLRDRENKKNRIMTDNIRKSILAMNILMKYAQAERGVANV